jgi:tRNA G18 (ribose-2'-O)-methylase SpoU
MNITLPDNRNIVDKYKYDRLTKWTTEMIKGDLQKSAFPCAVLMENFMGDFNIGTVVRNANAFNMREVYYLGMKHYDRRGTVGTHHYTDVVHLKDRSELERLKEKYVLVGLENSVETCVPMVDFEWPDNALIIVGEEGVGITPETIEICDKFVFIPQYGSVRSLNAGVASGIAMNDYVMKYTLNK